MSPLWEAWSRWFEGRLPDDAELWGMSLVFWGRLGKLLQFIAGLTVVLDLIGAERLRAWGTSARNNFLRGLAMTRSLGPRVLVPWRLWTGRLSWIIFPMFCIANGFTIYYMQVSIFKFGTTFAKWSAILAAVLIVVVLVPDNLWLGLFIYGVLLAIPFVLGYFLYGLPNLQDMPLWQLWLFSGGGDGGVGFILVALAAAALAYGLVAISALLLFLFAYFLEAVVVMAITTPIAWALDTSKPAHAFRWLALVLFLVGFHFDLLAS